MSGTALPLGKAQGKEGKGLCEDKDKGWEERKCCLPGQQARGGGANSLGAWPKKFFLRKKKMKENEGRN